LEDDEQFLGNEIVGMIANRFGKSCSAIVLAIATPTFLVVAPYILSGLCIVWLLISILLLNLLISNPKRNEKEKET
jgi:hypothetical protein